MDYFMLKILRLDLFYSLPVLTSKDNRDFVDFKQMAPGKILPGRCMKPDAFFWWEKQVFLFFFFFDIPEISTQI